MRTRVTPPASSCATTRPGSRFSRPASPRRRGGAARRARGSPSASTRPVAQERACAATARASPTLCVTYRHGTFHSSRMRSRYGRMRSRRPTSSAASGSSRSSRRGRVASARASATRCLSPPESATRAAVEERPDLEGVDGGLHGPRGRRAPRSGRSRGRSGAGRARRPGARSRHAAPRAGAARRRGVEQRRRPRRCARVRPRRSPATASRSDVLPEPEGPMTAVTPAGQPASTRSAKRGSGARGRSRLTRASAAPAGGRATPSSTARRRPGRPSPPRGRAPDRPADLVVVEDREGQGLRLPGDVAGDHHRGPELAERAREGEDGAGQDAAPGERQRDAEERARPGRSRACARCRRGAGRPPRTRCAPSARGAGRT